MKRAKLKDISAVTKMYRGLPIEILREEPVGGRFLVKCLDLPRGDSRMETTVRKELIDFIPEPENQEGGTP